MASLKRCSVCGVGGVGGIGGIGGGLCRADGGWFIGDTIVVTRQLDGEPSLDMVRVR